MQTDDYKVYIKTSNGLVIEINSSVFINDLTDWIYIDEGLGDKYHHAQGNYLDKPLYDMQGCHNYKYVGGKVVETTVEEKQVELASFPKSEPTTEEKLRADIEYLSAMTGVTL